MSWFCAAMNAGTSPAARNLEIHGSSHRSTPPIGWTTRSASPLDDLAGRTRCSHHLEHHHRLGTEDDGELVGVAFVHRPQQPAEGSGVLAELGDTEPETRVVALVGLVAGPEPPAERAIGVDHRVPATANTTRADLDDRALRFSAEVDSGQREPDRGSRRRWSLTGWHEGRVIGRWRHRVVQCLIARYGTEIVRYAPVDVGILVGQGARSAGRIIPGVPTVLVVGVDRQRRTSVRRTVGRPNVGRHCTDIRAGADRSVVIGAGQRIVAAATRSVGASRCRNEWRLGCGRLRLGRRSDHDVEIDPIFACTTVVDVEPAGRGQYRCHRSKVATILAGAPILGDGVDAERHTSHSTEGVYPPTPRLAPEVGIDADHTARTGFRRWLPTNA